MANKYKYEYNIPEGYEARIEGNRVIFEPKESEDERIRKHIIKILDNLAPCHWDGNEKAKCLAYLERQKEQKPVMIQWTGNNLKEVIDFTGKSPKFGKRFKSWEEYENYVHTHNDILKLFCEDGSYYEVPVGAWIVKTPDGYNVASQATFVEKQKNVYKPSNTQMYILNWVANILLNREGTVDIEAAKILQTLYDELKNL